VLFCVVVLCALGIDAWRDAWATKHRVALLAAGATGWLVVPLAAGAFPSRLILFIVGAVLGGVVLVAIARRPALLWVVPVLLSLELGTSVLIGQANGTELEHDGLETEIDSWLPMHPLPEPVIDAGDYVQGGRLARAIRAERSEDRVLLAGTGLTWLFRPAVARVEVAQGYNPVELKRYWDFMRRVVDSPIRYNMSTFPDEIPAPNVRDLLQVGWVGVRPGMVIPAGADKVTADRHHRLYRLDDVAPRAELIDDWQVATADDALEEVASFGFDSSETVLLERKPRFPTRDGIDSDGFNNVTYTRRGSDRVTIEYVSARRSILLVRNAWDENWHATIGGQPVDVLVADYFLQAVAVPAGHHTVHLKYTDPWIVPGLLGSAAALALLLAAVLIARRVERR
jgi:hypothetical protein